MQSALTEGEGTPFTGFGQEKPSKIPPGGHPKPDGENSKTQKLAPTTTATSQTSKQWCGVDAANKVTLQEPGSPRMGAVGAIFAATRFPCRPDETTTQPVDCFDLSRPFFNYDLCTCCVQLPTNYEQSESTRRGESEADRRKNQCKLAKAAIWCGLDECGVKELIPPNEKGVISKPIATWKSVPIRPGTCCYKNDQVIFQMPEKKEPINDSAYYKVDSGTGEPHFVQMTSMDDKPESDLCNDTFLMTISKLDDSGKPRKLQLAIKSPRDLDATPCITTATTQYATEDVPPGWPDQDGGKKKKGGGDAKGKGKGGKGKKKK